MTTRRYLTQTAIAFFIFIISYSIMQGDGHYIFDSIKFIIITIILYYTHQRLNLNLTTYTGLLVVMILHDLGRFGAYNWIIIVPWDIITHFMASYFITHFFYHALPTLRGFGGNIIILLATIGIATIGEFIEFGGAVITPNGQGILGVEARGSPIPWLSPDYWDTLKDLVINMLGAISSIIITNLRNVYITSKK